MAKEVLAGLQSILGDEVVTINRAQEVEVYLKKGYELVALSEMRDPVFEQSSKEICSFERWRWKAISLSEISDFSEIDLSSVSFYRGGLPKYMKTSEL